MQLTSQFQHAIVTSLRGSHGSILGLPDLVPPTLLKIVLEAIAMEARYTFAAGCSYNHEQQHCVASKTGVNCRPDSTCTPELCSLDEHTRVSSCCLTACMYQSCIIQQSTVGLMTQLR